MKPSIIFCTQLAAKYTPADTNVKEATDTKETKDVKEVVTEVTKSLSYTGKRRGRKPGPSKTPARIFEIHHGEFEILFE